MTVISYAHGVIFLKTRKTASTSTEIWLSSIAGPDDVITPLNPVDEQKRASMGPTAQNYQIPLRRYRPRDYVRRAVGRRPIFEYHMWARDVRAYVGSRVWDSFLKFTIERDSYDRAVSMYRFHTRSMPEPPGLLEFLRSFPQHKLANAPIYSIDGKVVADVVLDYANLAEDTAALQRLLNLPETSLVHANASSIPTADSRALLGPEGCEIVERACRFDVGLTLPEKRPGAVRRS